MIHKKSIYQTYRLHLFLNHRIATSSITPRVFFGSIKRSKDSTPHWPVSTKACGDKSLYDAKFRLSLSLDRQTRQAPLYPPQMRRWECSGWVAAGMMSTVCLHHPNTTRSTRKAACGALLLFDLPSVHRPHGWVSVRCGRAAAEAEAEGQAIFRLSS